MDILDDIKHACVAGRASATRAVDAVLANDYDGFVAAAKNFTSSAPIQRLADRISFCKEALDTFVDRVCTRAENIGIDRQFVRMLSLAISGGYLLASSGFIAKLAGLVLLIVLCMELYNRISVLVDNLSDILNRFTDEEFGL